MKKGIKNSIFMLVLLFLSIDICAQTRIGILDFKPGTGVSQGDVDGISAIFTTYFISPQDFILVERNQIEQVIREQGFQLSALTNNDIARIGQILNLQKIIVGDVNDIRGEYNVDVRVVDVETGSIQATDGATWSKGTSYRELMKTLATRLSTALTVRPVVNHPNDNSVSEPSADEAFVLYGYLKVFPKDLGVFDSAPNTVIDNLNKKEVYGYNNWRIPTNEEMSLILSNKSVVRGLGAGPYITSDGAQKGALRLVSTGASVARKNQGVTAKDVELIDDALRSTLYIYDLKEIEEKGEAYTIVLEKMEPILSECKEQERLVNLRLEEFQANPDEILAKKISESQDNMMKARSEAKEKYEKLMVPIRAVVKERIMNMIGNEKCAYVDGKTILYNRAENDDNMKKLKSRIEEEMAKLKLGLNERINDYEKNSHKYDSITKNLMEKEMKEIHDRMNSLQSSLNRSIAQALDPLTRKMISDVEQTARTLGYTHVIDKNVLERLEIQLTTLTNISDRVTN